MSKHPPNDHPRTGEVFGLMAEFETPAQIMHAARAVHDAGYKVWDCHTPFPVHGLDKAMGVKPTILPVLVFACGSVGLALGFLLQWFTNASSLEAWFFGIVRGYEYMISGKPMVSLPAWIPVMFELTILLSALATVGLMMVLNGLPRLSHPLFKSVRFARVTDDRFFVVIEARDPKFDPSATQSLLETLNPSSIEVLEP